MNQTPQAAVSSTVGRLVLQPFAECVLSRPLDCCGSRLVVRTRGQRWMCPCGRKHRDGFIRKMQNNVLSVSGERKETDDHE